MRGVARLNLAIRDRNGPRCGRWALAAPLLGWVLIAMGVVSPVEARTIRVKAGGDLQAAIDRARGGDTISVQAGATFTGPFTLPARPGRRAITIRSSRLRKLPRGRRVRGRDARHMPLLTTPGAGLPVVATAPGTRGWRLAGLELAVTDPGATVYALVSLGDGGDAQDSPAEVPRRITIERSLIHGTAEGGIQRCVALNSAATTIRDSRLTDCHDRGYDTQAIAGWNGPGPYRIENNLLEGATENVMFGGADPAIDGLVPSDIVIRRNLIRKPVSWRGRWTVKNLLELKNARRVRIEDNVFENNWADAQNGAAILFTVRNQDGGSPWSTVRDVRFTGNVVRRVGRGLNLLGHDDRHPSGPTRNVLIRSNVFERVGYRDWGDGVWMVSTDVAGLRVQRNTILNEGTFLLAYGLPHRGFRMTRNVARAGPYGIKGDGRASGLDTLRAYFPGAVVRDNVLAGAERSAYPRGNRFPRALRPITRWRRLGLGAPPAPARGALRRRAGRRGEDRARTS
jgi:hypothetical protein